MPSFNVSRDASGDAWFRIGRLDVTSTVLLVFAGALGMLVSTFVPAFAQASFFEPRAVLRGEVWRVVSWPLVSGVSLWTVLTLLMLWYFGRDLESQVGRRSMAWLYAGLWAMLTVVSLTVGFALGGGVLMGLRDIQFLILLLWIAEYPRRPFFFGIPAWALGAVLVALNLIQMLAPSFHACRWYGLSSAEQAIVLMTKAVELSIPYTAAFDFFDLIENKPTLKPKGALALI